LACESIAQEGLFSKAATSIAVAVQRLGFEEPLNVENRCTST
jgi:hypothetical protein